MMVHSHWNGTSAATSLVCRPPDIQFTTDATSGDWGCGVYWHPHWFQLEWACRNVNQCTHLGERVSPNYTIAIATCMGAALVNCFIQVQLDNTVAVAAINSNSSKVRESAHLLRCLAAAEDG